MVATSTKDLYAEFPVRVRSGRCNHEVRYRVAAWGQVDVLFNPCDILPAAARKFAGSDCHQALALQTASILELLQHLWSDAPLPDGDLGLGAEANRQLRKFLERIQLRGRGLAERILADSSLLNGDELATAIESAEPSLSWAGLVLARGRSDREIFATISRRLDRLPLHLQLGAVCWLAEDGSPATFPVLGRWMTDHRVTLGLSKRFAATLGRSGHIGAVEPLVDAIARSQDAHLAVASEAFGELFAGFAATQSQDARHCQRAIEMVLDTPQPEVRIRLMQLLQRLRNSILSPLTAILRGGTPLARAGAAEMLGGIGHWHSVEPLLNALDDPHERVSAAAGSALRELLPWLPELTDDALPLLVAALSASDPAVVVTAAETLGTLGKDAAQPSLSRLLAASYSNPVRIAAANALKLIGDTRCILPLLSASHQCDPPVAEAIGEALAQIIPRLPDDEGVLPILASACATGQPSVLIVAAHKLGRIPTESSIALLVPMLSNARPGVRLAAIDALGRIGSPAVLPQLIAMIDEDRPEISDSAVSAAEALVRAACARVPTDLEEICAALRCRNIRIATEAARVLGIIGDPAAIGDLVAACLRGSATLAAAAGKSLRRLGPETVVTLLTRVLRDGDDVMAAGAEEALVAIGPPAVAPLMKAVKWEYGRPRGAAVRALGRIGDRRAALVLRSAMKDRDAKVRHLAAIALRQLGETFPGGDLSSWPDSFLN